LASSESPTSEFSQTHGRGPELIASAETWDSPTDILYAHQSDGEDYDVKVDSDEERSSGIASPYTPYSAMLPTPRDSQVCLPSMALEGYAELRKPSAVQGDEALLSAAAARL